MKKLATIVLGILFLATAAGADPIPLNAWLDYAKPPVEVEPGMFQYTFTVYANDSENRSFAIENLRFQGDIQQLTYFFGPSELDVHTPSGAGFASPPYDINKDTWVFDGWTPNPPNMNMPITNPFVRGPATGEDIVLSIGSGTTGVTHKDVIQIVAIGDVTWNGMIFRNQKPFPTSGSTAGDGPSGETQGDPYIPNNSAQVHNRFNNHGAHGEPAFNQFRFGFGENDVNGFRGDGAWFDPPIVGAYLYETDGNSDFVAVKLPTGIDTDNQFILKFDDGAGTVVEIVEGGDPGYTFPDGVQSFIVSGIDGDIDPPPGVDAGDPLAFPTFLAFDETMVSFTMTGIPEPATMSLILFGAAGLLARRRRQR